MKLKSPGGAQSVLRKIERREWVLWSFAILVTLLLTAGLVSFIFPMFHEHIEGFDRIHYQAEGI